MHDLLQHKVVLVTGAGRGIGRGICEAVAEAGGAVAVTDLDGDAATATAAALAARGAHAVALEMDVGDERQVEAAIDAATHELGRLDGWVNNAGVLIMGTAEETGEAEWQRTFEVNVQALFACCRRAAERMRTQGTGGAIVNVASNAGKVGYPQMAAYNASKAAVISLTRSLAAEWAEHGINVNAVCPGGVDTGMLEGVARWIASRSGADEAGLYASMVPKQLGRHVTPLEVGRVVAFLLSDRALIVRGQAINVDGGDTPY